MSPILSARWAPPPSRPLILGHRGARHAAPENTLAAFELALREGAEGIELDVRLNASGDVIVCHDVTLERVTGGRDARAIHALSTAECQAVRLDGGERLPLLADVLAFCDQHEACVNVELKTDGHRRAPLVRAVAQLTRPRAGAGNVLISSFNLLAVLAHRALAPAVASAWLVESAAGAELPVLPRAGGLALHPKHTLITPARLARWRRQVGRIHTWTVNDPVRARELADLGVECLISDNPGRLIAALGATAARAPDVHAGGRSLDE